MGPDDGGGDGGGSSHGGTGGDGALISSDAPLALPLPASLAGGYSRNHAKIVVEPRLY